ncbi:amidase [Aaosphaeria arxii CBS 175.79]|uniref:Amidase n=1 Tax=Aaosphaeria arxii CBS 175.79 TaxID=1450172 RepID=A0A6A5Y8P5_9PLEO|nr:amidase [Aaosphaeria arxii CBS 175.79]KAF2021962.1 amidase [Aaosphaeria arxii CBS 175.79]
MYDSPNNPCPVIAKRAQEHRDATIAAVRPPLPDFDGLPQDSSQVPKFILTPEEIAITESDPADLVSKLTSGAILSRTVTVAFLRRAALAQKLTNCVTELLPVAALERSAKLDRYFMENGRPTGPLHGLPISIQEMIGIKGLTQNAGYMAWHDRIAAENAHIIDILIKAGAVLYARTTQPQTQLQLETSNNYFGDTVNPFNRKLTAGGSPGGEGALIGMRGSCLGLGTEFGGSLRSPAANNGLYGFKPTSLRLPTGGFMASMLAQEGIVPVVGPLSTSLEGVKLIMQTVLDSQPWDIQPSLVPIPWRTESQLERLPSGEKCLKVGVMFDDGVVMPHPPVLRAIKTVADALTGVKGIELVMWKPYRHDWAWEITSSLFFCDGAKEVTEDLLALSEPEPVLPLAADLIRLTNGGTVNSMWDWIKKRDVYRGEYAQLWRDVDVLLCPAGPSAAPLIGTAKYYGYSSQWNLLDYPAVVAPVTKVDPKIDTADPNYQPRNVKDKENHELYNAQEYEAAPVSIQLVAKRFQDEKLIEAMDLIKEKVGLPFASFT